MRGSRYFKQLGSPLIQGNVIAGNVQFGCSGGIGGGGISIGGDSSAEILDNVIANNVMTSADGGGISLFAAGRPVIKGNIISENEVSGLTPCTEGGGISVANFAQATIVNNLIIKNRAGCGGGVHWGASIGSTLVLVNNTIADNDALKGSGIFTNAFDSGLSQYFNNNIIAKAAQTALHCEGTGPSVMKSNNLYAPSGTAYFGCFDQTGTNGNISVDPLFVDPPNDNYLLHIGSPAIDSGDNTAPSLPVIDLDGYARIFDGDGVGGAVIDIGALEFSNRPPTANAGPDQTVAITTNCLATFTLDARASSDLNGDQLSFNWTGPFGIAPGPTPTVSLPKGTHVITLTVDDGNGGITQDTVTISVTDNSVPTIGSVAATPNVLRQANHQMVPVSINPAVFDCDSQVVCRIISVASNEPVEGLGDGDKTPDWVITGNLIVSLRAERSGKGNGRVYTITIECTDSSGNSSTKTVAVNVPRN
jgi:parallel beta-helix repeat protein